MSSSEEESEAEEWEKEGEHGQGEATVTLSADEELDQLQKAFHFLGTSPRVVTHKDSDTILYTSKPISRDQTWKSFVAYTDSTKLFAKCLVCNAESKLTKKKLWNAQMHLYTKHPHLATYKELTGNSKRWVGQATLEYDRAVVESTQPLLAKPTGIKRSFQTQSITSSIFAPKLSLKRTISIGIALGLKPLGYYDNAGDKYIIDHIVPVGDIKGLSRRNQTRDVELLFAEEFEIKKAELHAALEMPAHYKPPCKPDLNNEDDAKLVGVRLNGTQDAWSGINGRPFLAMNCFLMDVRSSPWKMWQTTMTCRHFPPPHNAVALGNLMKDESAVWDIPKQAWATWAQDTTGSSFNAWDDEEGGQTPCFSHVSQLFLKHAVENSPALLAAFDAVHQCATKIKNSSLRMDELTRCQEERNITKLVVVFHVETRWNSWVECIGRGKHNLPAYEIMQVNNMFRVAADKETWRSFVQDMQDSMPLMDAAMPIMISVAQWCQILTAKEVITISLVRLAIRCFRREVDKVKVVADNIDVTNASGQKTKDGLLEFHGALLVEVDKYFGDNYYDYWLFKCAEFLDPRTIFSIEEDEDFDEIIETLSQLAYAAELKVPEGQRVVASAMARRASAAANTNRKSLFQQECDDYVTYLTAMGEEEVMKIESLQWWADVGIYRFPILARMAMRILSAQPTSAETERVFSISGRVLNEARSRLTSSHINQIVCLHSWLKEKHGEGNNDRNAKRLAKSTRFATLSLALEVEAADVDPSDQDNLEYCYI
jgi:hypothetical protein